jgi:hypothetical protein
MAASAFSVCQDMIFNIGNATTNATYTDSQTNLSFKIDGTNYTQYDTYSFVAFASSSNQNTQKVVEMMQDGDILTVASGTTLQLTGQNATSNPTQITKGVTTTAGYSFNIQSNGNLFAQYFDFDYLGGTGGQNGLYLQTGASSTISDGSFDNFVSSTSPTSTDNSFITIHTNLIATGTPSKTLNNISLIAQTYLSLYDLLGDEEKKTYMGDVHVQSERIKKIVENLLAFSRQSDSTLKSLDLNEVLNGTLGLLDHHLSITSIHIEKDYGQVPPVLANHNELSQVFTKAGTFKIYAIGESYQGETFDYGWIVNASTSEKCGKLCRIKPNMPAEHKRIHTGGIILLCQREVIGCIL